MIKKYWENTIDKIYWAQQNIEAKRAFRAEDTLQLFIRFTSSRNVIDIYSLSATLRNVVVYCSMKRITVEKIAIYLKYGGDIDGYARIGKADEKSILDDKDFYLIDNFRQSFEMIRNGTASADFEVKEKEKLRLLADEEAFRLIVK